MNILGVKIDNLNHDEIIEKINLFLDDGKFHQIATVGPEFILEAEKNIEYKNVLNNCDLNVADGFGIQCAFCRYGKKLKSRVAGIDLIWKILRIANDKNLKFFLVANNRGLSSWEETRDAILKIYPKLTIYGVNLEINSSYKIPDVGYQIILCNFGAPRQEIFLNSLKNDIIGLSLGVGGSFDFITGKVKRAPRFLRRIGLEWLWRLIQQPWEQKGRRFKRIWNAVIIFPWKILWDRKEK